MELVKLTADEFGRMAKLIYGRTGIHLPESKLGLLSNRLRRRLRELELDSFQAYYELLCDSKKCEAELPHLLSAVTTNETYFFRNETLWEFVRNTWIPETVKRKAQKGRRTIRIWSAASSSGEEAYTAAICLREELKDFAQWRVSIVGSDISDRMLQKARDAEYNDYAVAKMSKAKVNQWFEARDKVFVLRDEIRKIVTFGFHNLRDPYPDGNFDLIFLRNVLMYFDTPMKLKVLDAVTNALTPGGHLVVGDVDPIKHTAELNEAMRLEYCGPNLYRKPLPSTALAGATARD